MVSVAEFLYRRGSFYYFYITIPTDIRSHFGNRRHLVKSLKTRLLCDAKVAVEPMKARVKTAFLLIRSGMLTEEQLQKTVTD
ncbi:hypothetical protein KP001_11905 [Geomonas subterranea]|nr:DUF6538 domain-containing protein [Geomonas subterranea]QXE89171.1 hypothetical protein KP001_11905 [Geomonas subterranea]QXM08712.1 hypothetical protein KP002_17370 [Geomonas subterranea]